MKLDNKMEAEMLMKMAMDSGATMLANGAEIYRTEDTMMRIFMARENVYDPEVVCTYSSIMASFYYKDKVYTSIKKIRALDVDLNTITEFNNFSREFVKGEMNVYKGYDLVREIKNSDSFNFNKRAFMGSMGSAFMTMALNGRPIDGFFTFLFVFISQYILKFISTRHRNYFMETLATSFIIAILSVCLYKLGVGLDYNLVIIGGIYFLFPGVSLTNSVRDLMNGDLVSGVVGFFRAVLVAAALAIGVASVAILGM